MLHTEGHNDRQMNYILSMMPWPLNLYLGSRHPGDATVPGAALKAPRSLDGVANKPSGFPWQSMKLPKAGDELTTALRTWRPGASCQGACAIT